MRSSNDINNDPNRQFLILIDNILVNFSFIRLFLGCIPDVTCLYMTLSELDRPDLSVHFPRVIIERAVRLGVNRARKREGQTGEGQEGSAMGEAQHEHLQSKRPREARSSSAPPRPQDPNLRARGVSSRRPLR